jgi:transcription-repair coupling factor (superfamily II helicase)
MTQLSLEKQKKITIIPNVENKVFRKIEKVLDYISRKRFYPNSEDLFSQLDKQFDRAEEAFEKLSKDIKHATPDQFFKPKDFYKKSLDFFR